MARWNEMKWKCVCANYSLSKRPSFQRATCSQILRQCEFPISFAFFYFFFFFFLCLLLEFSFVGFFLLIRFFFHLNLVVGVRMCLGVFFFVRFALFLSLVISLGHDSQLLCCFYVVWFPTVYSYVSNRIINFNAYIELRALAQRKNLEWFNGH